ncbi:hypothetical protein [Arthrobacter parietis]|uniref:hypothetical protein n=1 Tax=Arthrobacter parietis TaxID=271434 RepID=UPI0031F9F82D
MNPESVDRPALPPLPPATPRVSAPSSSERPVDPLPVGGGFRDIGHSRWLSAGLAGVIAYGVTVFAAFAVLLLVALGLVLSAQDLQASLDEYVGVETPSDVGGAFLLLALPFQLAGMAMMGALHADLGLNVLGMPLQIGAVGWGVPLALTGIAVLTLWFLGRRSARSQTSITSTQAWMLSAVSGLTLALVGLLLSFLLAVRISENGMSAVLTSASLPLFFGALAIGTLGSRLGHHHGSATTHGLLQATARRRAGAEILAGVRIFCLHYMAYTLVSGLVLFIFATVKGGAAAAFSAPLWLPTAAGWAYGIGHLSSVSNATSQGTDSMTVFDLSWWAALLLILLAITIAFVASIAWAAARASYRQREGWMSWAILPAIFLVGGLLITLFTSVVFGVRGGALSFSGTLALALWTPLIMGLWGAAIEVSGRYLAPVAVPFLPAIIHRWFSGPTATADSAVAGTDTGRQVEEVPGAGGRETKPLTAHAKKRLRIGTAIAGIVILLIVAATVAFNILSATTYGPQAHVEKYLKALEEGDASAAVALHDPNVTSEERLLLDDGIFGAAQNRITDHEIRDVEFSGELATVTAEVTQDAKRVPLIFTLEKAERTALFFHNWTVTRGTSWTLPIQVPEGVDMVTVNGVDVELSQQLGQQAPGAFSLPVLPGDYVLTPPEGTKYVTLGEEQTITVSADPASSVGEGALFQRSMTDAVTEDAVAQAREFLQTCADSTEAAPEDCPNRAFTFGDDEDYRNFSWTITQEPEFEVSENWDGSLALYATEGEMTATYERNTQWQDDEPAEWEPEEDTASLYFSAAVQIDGDQLTLSFED